MKKSSKSSLIASSKSAKQLVLTQYNRLRIDQTPARCLFAWVFHGTADDRRNGASLFLLFSVSPFSGSPVVGVDSPPTSRDNYVRDTPFSETCDRDCKMFVVCGISYIDGQNVRSFAVASVFFSSDLIIWHY